jgi:pantoate--beta-alanine ligase
LPRPHILREGNKEKELALAPALTETVVETRQAVAAARGRKLTLGLVPTMGALHAGHASLMRQARAETDFVVVSIFVNPAQFGPQEDWARYPRPWEQDVALCAAEGVDLIFHPEPIAMYPPSYRTYVEVHGLQDMLCGPSRPGHFRGVATVVLKLLNIVQPERAYFGQKDAQQARLLEQMVRDLEVPVAVRVCPIVRAADGLALSSRNVYLNPVERKQATVLNRSLEEASRRVAAGERGAAVLMEGVKARIAQVPDARLDYVSVVDMDTLAPVAKLHGRVLVALAVFIGATRLIDNVILEVKD